MKKKMRRKKKRKIRKGVEAKLPTFKKLKKKIVFFVIDGLADLPINNKTPLSEAKKPNLDWLTRNGVAGEILPVEKKMWSELANASISHVANFGLLGYDVKKYYVKRGPIETVGSDQPYENGHLALRCNFANIDKEGVLLDRRVGRNSLGLSEISRYINENVDIGAPFIFRQTFGHRAVLVIKKNLDDNITDSDPKLAGEKVKKVLPLTKEAEESARLVQSFIDKSRSFIEFHPSNELRMRQGLVPANIILTREAGNKLPIIKSFLKRYRLNRAVCISENGVMKGSCMLAGFDSITVPELKLDSYLKFIFDNIVDALAEYDLVYVHIKAVDEPGHDGDFHLKRSILEKIDEKMEIFRNFDGIVIVTCDHITACKTRRHEWGPVPIIVYGKGKDMVEKFDEFSVKKGRLRLINGNKLWKFVLGR